MEHQETPKPQEILVVDDTPSSLRFLLSLLTEAGFLVRPASSGSLALRSVSVRQPDLILLDVNMPQMDGYEVCRRLKEMEETRNIPVVFISALGDAIDKVKGFQAGGVDYITKPFEPQEVLARIRLHVRLRELTEHLEQEVGQRTRQLQESEERYRSIFENAVEGIFQTTPGAKGRFISANPAHARILGYDSPKQMMAEVTEIGPLIWIDPQDRKAFSKQVAKGTVTNFEVQLRHRDGQPIWVSLNARPILDVSGKLDYIEGIMLDITNRKRAEGEQQKLQNQLANALELAHLGHWEYDVEADLFTFNDQFYKIFRTTVEQVGGYQMSSAEYSQRFIYPEDMEMVGKELRKAIETTDPTFNRQLEHRIIYDDGKIGHITVQYYVVKDENGKTLKTYGVNQDITERKNMERQLQQAQKMESIGILAGGIAHDFNNILSAIVGFTELALDDVPSGTTLEDNLQEVYSAGQRARELVLQILAFARESDEKRIPIRPNAIVKEVLKFLRSTIPTTIEIQQEIKSESSIMGSATQVHQILMNLCTNAAHAMENTGGIMKVSMKDVVLDRKNLLIGIRPGHYVEIKVSDTGVGIAPELIESIFDPYFTTKEPGEGTGMGLAVVYGIIESYHGKISVDSQLAKGTIFTFYLPITKKRATHRDYNSDQLPSGAERILFVDDEALITKVGSQILKSLGYSVTTRTSSVEALELFKAKRDDFDLVITDMTMPNLTGDKLAVELMKIRPNIPVILCTGYSKKISDETASEIGIKAFAYKPVVKAKLAKIIRKVLGEAKF